LLQNRDAILADVQRCANRTRAVEPRARTLTVQAVKAARDGHIEAAQALAGSMLTHLAETLADTTRNAFPKIRKTAKAQHPEQVGISQLRTSIVRWTLARVLVHTDNAPAGFNRHATAGHSSVQRQFTEEHCLSALLLLGGLLREVGVIVEAGEAKRTGRR
jgi:hypothetical protein